MDGNYYANNSYGPGYPQPQQGYNPAQPPVYPANMAQQDEHFSVGQWIGIWCWNLIPVVGGIIYLIVLCVYAFGDTPKKSVKNWAKAKLIIMLVVFIISIIATVIMMVFFSAFFYTLAESLDSSGYVK